MFTKRVIVSILSLACMLAVVAFVYIDDEREPVFMHPWVEWEPGHPVTVGWEPALWEFDDDIKAAIGQINREVGCNLLAPNGPTGMVTIRLTNGQPCNGGEPMSKESQGKTYPCGGDKVEIQFKNLADPASRFPLLVHELGHALGLAHDTSGPSVMRTPVPLMVHGTLAPGFTSKDRKALRARLCR